MARLSGTSRRELLRALLAPLLMPACRWPGAAPRRLRAAFPSAPASLDPHVANEAVSFAANSNLYEALVAVGPEQRLQPSLATTWQTLDDLTWLFELRAGARFHDGRPVRARDVAWSLERLRDDPRSEWRDSLVDVAAIEVPAEGRVLLRTRWAQATLPSRLQGTFVVPEGARDLDQRPLGSGPYRLARRAPGQLVLELVPGDTRSALGEISFLSLPDPGARVEAVARGTVELATDLPADSVEHLAALPGVKVLQVPSQRQLFLGFDVARERTPYASPERNPFRDRRVRLAVLQAIDTARIVEQVYGRAAEPAHWLAAPGIAGYDAGYGRPPHDPAAARRLLAGAGLATGFRCVLHAPHGVYSGDRELAGAVAAELGRVGIAAEVEGLDKAGLFGRLARRDTSFYLMSWNCLSGDLQEVLNFLFHTADPARGYGTENAGGYSSPELDRLAEEAAATLPTEERLAKLKQAARIALEDVACVPLAVYRQIYALRAPFRWRPRGDRALRGQDVLLT